MSTNTRQDGKKWIQTSTALTCGFLTYVLMSFFETMGEWFELESKIPNFFFIQQALAVVIGVGVFVYIMKNEKTSTFLADVYQETIKVIWPDKSQTNRHTIGIIIGVTICGFILGFFDYVANFLLGLIR